MTREERLDLLKQIEKDIYVCSLESNFLDDAKSCAIRSAIEELEQEPCEDCVSKEILKKEMLKYGWSHPDSTVTEFVDSLPSVGKDINAPTTDCVSRKEVIDLFPDNVPFIGYNKKCIKEMVNELPSVKPATAWHKVEDELPRVGQSVIVHTIGLHPQLWTLSEIKDRDNLFNEHGDNLPYKMWTNGLGEVFELNDVIAWTELPEWEYEK